MRHIRESFVPSTADAVAKLLNAQAEAGHKVLSVVDIGDIAHVAESDARIIKAALEHSGSAKEGLARARLAETIDSSRVREIVSMLWRPWQILRQAGDLMSEAGLRYFLRDVSYEDLKNMNRSGRPERLPFSTIFTPISMPEREQVFSRKVRDVILDEMVDRPEHRNQVEHELMLLRSCAIHIYGLE